MMILAGAILLLVWSALTLVSRGIPAGLCEKISALLPPVVHPLIMKMHNGFYYDVPNKEMPSEVFFLLFTAAFGIYCIAIYLVSKGRTGKNSLLPIVIFAVLFRLVLIPSIPVHENDFYRYIWDGKVFLSGVNPFKYAPEEAEGVPGAEDPDNSREVMVLTSLRAESPVYFSRIGHRQVPTIYPPISQLVFAAASFVSRVSIPCLKLVFICCDILVILVLSRLLRHFEMNPNMVVVYAWSPLVLKEIANSCHNDSFAILFIMLSLLFLFRRKVWSSALCLSLGILSKFFPLVTLPLFLKKAGWKTGALIGVLLAGLYLPFFIWGGTGPLRVFTGLAIYARDWSAYGGIFKFAYACLLWLSIPAIADPFLVTKGVCAGAYLAVLIFLTVRTNGNDFAFLTKLFWALAWLFLLSPVGDPWYFCWVIPFLCFFPYRSFIILSWALVFNYLSFTRDIGAISLGSFSISWLIAAQYIPFYALLIAEVIVIHRRERLHVSRS